jgi:hypothetical protein
MPEMTSAEITLLARYQNLGTPDEIQKQLKDRESDNGKQRDEIRVLKEKVPKDTEVVILKTEAALLDEYKPLGKPKDIQARFKAGDDAGEKAKLADQRTAATKFAKAVGLAEDSVEALVAFPALKDATFEVKKGKVRGADGIEVDGDIGYITLAGDGEKPMEFSAAQEKVAALKGLKTSSGTPEPTGVVFPALGDGTKGAPKNVYDKIRADAEARTKADEKKPAPRSARDRLGMLPGR